ncbi:Reverse transcriptase domain [Trinorchestia longiramus]|nr:Reverse transcriptase domain [Trinorchestia longiramus]
MPPKLKLGKQKPSFPKIVNDTEIPKKCTYKQICFLHYVTWSTDTQKNSRSNKRTLTNIFNRSLETGITPDDWKRANVTAIFKKRNKQIPNNYRPISLTSVISKTKERLLKVRITKHLNDQNLINDTQHGFREKRSCLTNLLDFFGEVNRIYDRTKAVDLVYLDFQKAFDKVPHERLMAKVEARGMRGNYSRWIRNWLTGSIQGHDERSDSTLVTSGVPQGSVLGLLLFIIYINDLYVRIISKINKFADDTKLSHRAFTGKDRATIQSDLTRLLQWIETWQMSFNIEKCSVMLLGANNCISNTRCMTYLLKQSSNKEI